MEQIIQEQIYTKENNKAKVGLILGIVSLLAWISGFVSLSVGGGTGMFFGLLSIFAILGVIGIILSILGFKAHKIKALFGITFCLFGIAPLFILTQFAYQIGYLGNVTYKEVDFSIEIPDGWVKLDSTSETKEAGIRVAFAAKQNNDVYKPIIFVTSLEIEEANELNTFAQGEEVAIKSEYNFISGKTMEVEGKTLYIINYTFDNNGDEIRGMEALAVKNGVGYIIQAESLQTSWEKYKTQFARSLLSFKSL